MNFQLLKVNQNCCTNTFSQQIIIRRFFDEKLFSQSVTCMSPIFNLDFFLYSALLLEK